MPFDAKGNLPDNKKGVIIIFLKPKYYFCLIILLLVTTFGVGSNVAFGEVTVPQTMKAYNVSLEGREYLQEGYVDKTSWQADFDSYAQEAIMLNDELVGLLDYLPEESATKLNNFDIANFNYIGDIKSYIDEMAVVRDDAMTQKQKDLESLAAKQKKIQDQQRYSAASGISYNVSNGSGLTRSGGVNYYNNRKETYYNLDMSGVVSNAQAMGIQGNYWVRDDGVKMYGDYVIVASQDSKGSIINTSLGQGIVLDYCPAGTVDIATNWN